MSQSPTGAASGLAATLAGVTATLAVFAIGLGLTFPLMAFVLERQGVSAGMIGLNAAMAPLGVILTAPLVPALCRKVGTVRLVTICSLATGLLLLTMAAWRDLWLWFPLRFLFGAVINTLFVVSEAWVTQLATGRNRGRIVGIYATVLAGGFALGPATLGLVGTEGWTPFLLGVAAALAAAAILMVLRHRLPQIAPESEGGSLRRFLPVAPLLLLAVGAMAAFDQAVMALMPVYGLGLGWSEARTTLALTVMIGGNLVLQVMVGWFGDRVGRRAALILCTGLTCACGVALPFVVTVPLVLWPLLFVWGGAAFGIYTNALAALGDRFSGGMLLAGTAAYAVMWGVGGLLGPPAGGFAMQLVGPHGLPVMLALLFGAVLAATLASPRLVRPEQAEDETEVNR